MSTNHRIHLTLCYQDDKEDVTLEEFITILERVLPGGALVTVAEHKGGYCVAGDRDWIKEGS
jgi:hypothetical protein